MKRSRDSQYNKKRPRDKKDPKRKFTFSTNKTENKETSKHRESSQRTSVNKDARKNTTSKKSDAQKDRSTLEKKPLTVFQDDTTDFEVYTKQDQQYQQRTTHRKKKSILSKATWPIIIIGVFFFIRIIGIISNGNQNSRTETIPNRYEPTVEETVVPTRSKKRISTVDISYLMVGKGKRLREVLQLTTDSIIPIVPYVNVRLSKSFHIYDSSVFPSTPILAKYARYYFFYDIQDANPEESLIDQWVDTRTKFLNVANDDYFYHETYKNYTPEDMIISEQKFSVLVDGIVVYGAATLIEYENKRHFFHFIAKDRIDAKPNYAFLRRYMNYYLKIKVPST